MAAHCHCFEIKACPKSFCGAFICCPRKSAVPGKAFKKQIKQQASVIVDRRSPADLVLELTDASAVALPKMEADEMDMALFAHVGASGIIRSLNSGPKADVLLIRSHGETIQTRFPHMLYMVVSALIDESLRTSCRKQVTVAINKHGPFTINAYPIIGAAGAIGATVIIKPRIITATELARFIK
jgi:hypothetical protein